MSKSLYPRHPTRQSRSQLRGFGCATSPLRSDLTDKSRIAFADESGTNGKPKCYAIGVLSIATKKLDGFNRVLARLKKELGVNQEVRWKSVGKGRRVINLAIDWLHRILKSDTAHLDVIVVNMLVRHGTIV